LSFFLSFCIYTLDIYFLTLSLHDALPIYFFHLNPVFLHIIESFNGKLSYKLVKIIVLETRDGTHSCWVTKQWKKYISSCSYCKSDRKSTRLNSSHVKISYAVFCLKKKMKR